MKGDIGENDKILSRYTNKIYFFRKSDKKTNTFKCLNRSPKTAGKSAGIATITGNIKVSY